MLEYKSRSLLDDEQWYCNNKHLDDTYEAVNNLIEAATNYVEAQRLNLTADMAMLSDKLFAAVKELQNG